jgi:hypothetical protein
VVVVAEQDAERGEDRHHADDAASGNPPDHVLSRGEVARPLLLLRAAFSATALFELKLLQRCRELALRHLRTSSVPCDAARRSATPSSAPPSVAGFAPDMSSDFETMRCAARACRAGRGAAWPRRDSLSIPHLRY